MTSIRSGARRAPLLLLLLGVFAGTLFASLPARAGTPDEYLRQAREAQSTGDLQAAERFYLMVPPPGPLGDDGQFVESRMQVARQRFALKDLDGAEAAAREVLAVYPDNAEAVNLAGSVVRERLPKWRRYLDDTLRFLPTLLHGSLMTLALVLFTMAVSPFGGLLIALGRISPVKLLSGTCWFVIWFFRGTPLLLQLFFIYYGLPALGVTLKPMSAAFMGLGLNYSAYLAEIIRGAIQSIDHGQTEAAKALGMTPWQTMRRVIIPQTYKRLVPPVGNEFIALIKDTALVSTIAMVELMRSADQIFNAYFNVTVLVLAAAIYLCFTSVFTFVFERVEHRLGVYERR
ncbi:ABC transporter permease subunit [Desulfovibrio aminophilus]|uniref:amino acid ABC transporter permease n=1 Tax=Desulfovibrio aminophilus TaxID=81425 RepID=UPI00339656B1